MNILINSGLTLPSTVAVILALRQCFPKPESRVRRRRRHALHLGKGKKESERVILSVQWNWIIKYIEISF